MSVPITTCECFGCEWASKNNVLHPREGGWSCSTHGKALPESTDPVAPEERRRELHTHARVSHDSARIKLDTAQIHYDRNEDLWVDNAALMSIAHSLNALVALKLREVE